MKISVNDIVATFGDVNEHIEKEEEIRHTVGKRTTHLYHNDGKTIYFTNSHNLHMRSNFHIKIYKREHGDLLNENQVYQTDRVLIDSTS